MGISAALFNLLLAYYSCDHMASTRLLSFNEVQMCATIYKQVKTEISGLDNTNPEGQVEVYLSWKKWEQENQDLVEEIKRIAIEKNN